MRKQRWVQHQPRPASGRRGLGLQPEPGASSQWVVSGLQAAPAQGVCYGPGPLTQRPSWGQMTGASKPLHGEKRVEAPGGSRAAFPGSRHQLEGLGPLCPLGSLWPGPQPTAPGRSAAPCSPLRTGAAPIQPLTPRHRQGEGGAPASAAGAGEGALQGAEQGLSRGCKQRLLEHFLCARRVSSQLTQPSHPQGT